jgi:capsular polysaccharide transport system permease protein
MAATIITHGTRGPATAVAQHARVVLALMLRDIKTRFGGSYLGFFVGLLMPLAHIGILLVAFTLLGRRAPIGTDVPLFLASALVPFVVWSYTHRHVMMSFSQNKALLSFPIVRVVDILVARALVELLNAVLVFCVVALAFALRGSEIFIADMPGVTLALGLAYALGIATGFLMGIFVMLSPAVMLGAFLLVPLYYVTAGAFFIPDALPPQIRAVVAIFPLSHVVDHGRTALYASYLSDYPSLSYVIITIVAMVVLSFGLEHLLRPLLTAS